ncbi:MAG: hypothetical protein KAH25_03945 [Bacteroidales bacterium]|nr:hypothetical protein [Bacteroidales bacterium]
METLMDVMKQKGDKAKIIASKMSKSLDLAFGIIYEGTLNNLFAKSGAGKTKITVILMLHIAKMYPKKSIYYFAPDISNDDITDINSLIDREGIDNFILDQDSTGTEFMTMMEEYGKTDGVEDIIFVVDTLKKIVSVNNKDAMSKTMGTLRQVVSRGATGILIGHTNKDGEEMSGTAEVEQDVDNVLTIDFEYIGEDKMQSTILPAPEKRCRSRIGHLTLEMNREGFEYDIITKPVDSKAIAELEKVKKQYGNLVEIAQEIVQEYEDKKEPLTKTSLQKEIQSSDTYNGNKKNELLSKMIDKLGADAHINIEKDGRKLLCATKRESN